MTPDQTRDVARTFDAWAEAGRGEGMQRGHLATAGALLDDLPIEPGDRFLDLGTGIGWAARYAQARGARAVGVDVAPVMLARARAVPGAPVDVALASFEHLPLADESFQVAFSMEALYYAGDLAAALAEVHRVTAPEGRIHFLVDYYEENDASHGWPELTGVSMHLLAEGGWTAALQDAGFVDVGSQRLRAAPGSTEEAWKVEEGTLHLFGQRPA